MRKVDWGSKNSSIEGDKSMGDAFREVGSAAQALADKVDVFLRGVTNPYDSLSPQGEYLDSLRPLLRSFIAVLIVDAPHEACHDLSQLIAWNVAEGRLPEDFLSWPGFLENKDYLENHFSNCTIDKLLDRVRIMDQSSRWSTVIDLVDKRLKNEQLNVLNLFSELS
jgi:hypothetical protein